MKFNKWYLALAVVGSILVGCASAPTPTQTALITALTMDGTVAVLQNYPNDEPLFDEASAALTIIGTSTNLLSYQTIDAVLQDTGQTNAAVKLAFANVIPLANAYIGTNSPNIAVQSASVKTVCLLIAGGIKNGESLVKGGD